MRKLLALLIFAGACYGTGGAYVAYDDPPPPREEVVVSTPGYFWVHGHWWNEGGHWRWMPGHQERERAGYAYVEGRWEHQGNRRVWVNGGWRARGQVVVRDHRHY